MKKQSQLGLVIEGSATASAVLRASRLAVELGPVKAATVRVARRLSNVLKAGCAVEDYEDLQGASLVLLRMPDAAVSRIVDEICASELVLKDMSFVLCESWLTGDVLRPLAKQGASTATLMNLPTTQRDWFVVEGAPKAVRQVRRFLERSGVRSDELRAESKHLLFASQMMATAVTVPVLLSAQQALRTGGFSGNILSALLEQMTLKMLHDFLRGGRATWGGPLNECTPEISESHFQTLREKNPDIAAFVDEQIVLARRVMLSVKS